jgi:hypothetical protein
MLVVLLLVTICACYGTQENFVRDVVTNIVDTIGDGVENARKIGSKQYSLFLEWQQENSRLEECRQCHKILPEENYTTDPRKINARNFQTSTSGMFVFPTHRNTDIPRYMPNKENTLVTIMKELVDIFSGMDIHLNGDTCCHYYTLFW